MSSSGVIVSSGFTGLMYLPAKIWRRRWVLCLTLSCSDCCRSELYEMPTAWTCAVRVAQASLTRPASLYVVFLKSAFLLLIPTDVTRCSILLGGSFVMTFASVEKEAPGKMSPCQFGGISSSGKYLKFESVNTSTFVSSFSVTLQSALMGLECLVFFRWFLEVSGGGVVGCLGRSCCRAGSWTMKV